MVILRRYTSVLSEADASSLFWSASKSEVSSFAGSGGSSGKEAGQTTQVTGGKDIGRFVETGY